MSSRSTNETPGIVLGMTIQVARKYFFFETRKKAVIIFCGIFLLSFIASFITFPEDVYIVQKHSVFNQYGVKLGWFWTWVFVAPFIFFTAKAAKANPYTHLLRLIFATFLWWFCVGGFHRFMHLTSRCDKSGNLSRTQCSEKNGTWIPGFDISGHCFLMVYSMLIMSEEAKAFRSWNQVGQGLQGGERQKHEDLTRLVQYFFIGMFVLSMVWIKQLVISTLYYHIWYDKVAGALFAIGCWTITYRVLYPLGLAEPPIHRKPEIQKKPEYHSHSR